MRRTLALLAAAAAVCGAAAGCGGDNDRDEARAAVQRYLAALSRGDAGGACAQFTDESREALAEFARDAMKMKGGTCQTALGRLLKSPQGAGLKRLGHAKVTVGEVHGGKAEARIAGVSGKTDVVKAGGGWRIESRPTGETD